MTAEARTLPRHDWALANPWPYAIVGLVLSFLGWGWALAAGDALTGLRATLVFIALVTTGVGLVLRLNSTRSAFLDRASPGLRNPVLWGLAIAFALLAFAVTFLLLARPFHDGIPWKFATILIFWIFTVPAYTMAAKLCFRSAKEGSALSEREETALLLVLAALTTFCSHWALYNPDQPLNWDTIRTFLWALMLVPLLAAPLVLISQTARRFVISLLIVFHLGGMCTAALAAPPSPMLISHLWTRVYRPYVEFMYLNNAYHFYAPEPGPASYVWFRIFYVDETVNLKYAQWYKIPHMDERGRHGHAVSLEYQRHLSISENVATPDPTPSTHLTNGEFAPWFGRRLELAVVTPAVVGKAAPAESLRIPFQHYLSPVQQYAAPSALSKAHLECYARFACRLPHDEHPHLKVKSVKIYRVRHVIAPWIWMAQGTDPRDPELYHPFYMGEYSPEGKLLDADSPYLYWLLPNNRENTADKNSDIRCWALRHAEDSEWIYRYSERERRYVLSKEE
ncbi:MAG: hypothetical protein L0Y72_18260 [Gemmataceae bacterium]|nr:hypothetical protein [Gemmataceae bacterium]MCI0740995.1 hypothetical protein [Gemmataceae bacterium]